jgi:hypothetical protein
MESGSHVTPNQINPWTLARPRWWSIAVGPGFLGANWLAGLVLPVSTKSSLDDVLDRKGVSVLSWLLGAVAAASVVQAATSFLLGQTQQGRYCEMYQRQLGLERNLLCTPGEGVETKALANHGGGFPIEISTDWTHSGSGSVMKRVLRE